MSIDHAVHDDGDLRKYRTEIPNIVFAKLAAGEITGADFILYAVLKRTAGDHGNSTKATKTLIAETGLNAGAIVAGKRRLVNAGLIQLEAVERVVDGLKLGGRPFHRVTVSDVWPANFAMFSGSRASSPTELASSPAEQASSAGGTKERTISSFPSGQEESGAPEGQRPAPRATTPDDDLAEALPVAKAPKTRATKPKAPPDPRVKELTSALADWQGYTACNWAAEGAAAKRIINAGYTVADVKAVWRTMKADPFWRDKHLSLASVYPQMGAKLGKPGRRADVVEVQPMVVRRDG